MSKLVNMEKSGVVLSVNPACVEAHARQGWAVTQQKATVVEDAPENEPTEEEQALATARAEYNELAGKKAHHTWDVAALNAKIAELTKPE